MSDTPQGPGWWEASDHKWYPPEAAAGEPQPLPPPPAQPAAKRTSGAGCLVAIGIVLVLFVAALIGGGNDDSDNPVGNDLDFAAVDVCHQFVKARLKAPSTADFESFNEAVVTGVSGGTFAVSGHVDAENSFGAKIRSNYRCAMDHISGTRFELISLTGLE